MFQIVKVDGRWTSDGGFKIQDTKEEAEVLLAEVREMCPLSEWKIRETDNVNNPVMTGVRAVTFVFHLKDTSVKRVTIDIYGRGLFGTSFAQHQSNALGALIREGYEVDRWTWSLLDA